MGYGATREAGGRENDRYTSRDKVRGDDGEETEGGGEFWDRGGDVERGEDRAVVEGREPSTHMSRPWDEEGKDGTLDRICGRDYRSDCSFFS